MIVAQSSTQKSEIMDFALELFESSRIPNISGLVENKGDKTKGGTYKDIFYLHQLQNLICEHTGIKFFLHSNNQQ